MSFVEFIGFVISLVAMIFLVTKHFWEERKKRLNPEEYEKREKQQEENLRRFLKSIDVNVEDEEEFSPPPVPKIRTHSAPPLTQQQQQIKLRDQQRVAAAPLKKSPTVNPGNYGVETATDKKRNLAASQTSYALHPDLKLADSYEVIRVEKISPTNGVLSRLQSPKDMLIIKEIFDKPLSMREHQDNKW